MAKKHDETADDIEWIEIQVPGKEEKQRACSVGDARLYLGVSGPWLNIMLNDNNVTRWSAGHGATKYILESDLKELNRIRQQVRPANARISAKQLLAEAATLLQQVQAGKINAEAITTWLEQYQKE